MKKPFSFTELRPMDCILTTSGSWVARIIRLRTAGFKGWSIKSNIASHAGIVVEKHLPDGRKSFEMAEMMPRGLEINPIHNYFETDKAKSRIVCVVRNKCFENDKTMNEAQNRIFTMHRFKAKYDYRELLKYVFPFLGDCKKRYYCSELFAQFCVWYKNPLRHPKYAGDNFPPYGIQTAKNLDIVWARK